ncbi:MAG: RNA repair domain-containing protein [Candidatus Odinarchaeota archaeon]
MRINDLLNKLRWDPYFKNKIVRITYVHRGVAGNTREITSDKINRISDAYFTYINNSGEEIVIPYHRILIIRDEKSKEVLWARKIQPTRL